MGWDSFKLREQQAAAKPSSYQQMHAKVKNEMAGLMRKLKFDAMVSGGGTSYGNLVNSLKNVGVKVPFGRRLTPMEAQRAAQQGFLKKRAY